MSLHFFAIAAREPQPAQDEFNAFCVANRVVTIEREFVNDGLKSYWAFCVTVANGSGPLPDALKRSSRTTKESGGAGRVDYKEVLSEGDFEVFATLRHWRKTTAEQEGLPVYAVFTNEQLATIARERCASLADLRRIEGVGASRVERYGDAVLRRVAEFVSGADSGTGQ